jgi:hypothetical protein
MLEQVQRGAATAIEQLDELGLGDEGVLALQALQQRVQLEHAGQRQRRLAVERFLQLGDRGAERGVGVAQQRGQHAQRVGDGPLGR